MEKWPCWCSLGQGTSEFPGSTSQGTMRQFEPYLNLLSLLDQSCTPPFHCECGKFISRKNPRAPVHFDTRVDSRATPCSRALKYFHPGVHSHKRKVMKVGDGQRERERDEDLGEKGDPGILPLVCPGRMG